MSRIRKIKTDLAKFDYSKLGRFWPVFLVIGLILAPLLLFFLSVGFRKAILGIVATFVEKFILSNLLIANLIFILVIIVLIIIAIYIFNRL